MQRDRVGILGANLGGMAVDELEKYTLEIEGLGYGSMWILEHVTREPIATAAHLLARTSRIEICTGIASVYARDAVAAAQAAHTLAELSAGRFRMGIGPTYPAGVELRGQTWQDAPTKIRAYLETMRATEVMAPAPQQPAPIYVAASMPKLIGVAAELADGVLTNYMPVEHTRWVRELVGPDKEVIPCVRIHLDPDRERGRKLARRHLELQGFLRAYRSAWKRLGMIETVEESAEGIDDELLQAVNAFGDVALILERIEAHLDAGASRVILVAVADAIEGHEVGLSGFRELAEAVWG